MPAEIVNLFRTERERIGLTQADVAEVLHISAKAYSKIETGRNTLRFEYVKPLCDLLRIPYVKILHMMNPMFAGIINANDIMEIQVKNPIITFRNREKNGDFDPLKPGENTDSLPADRCPLDDEPFEKAKWQSMYLGRFWEGHASLDIGTVLTNMLEICAWATDRPDIQAILPMAGLMVPNPQ